MRGTMLIFRPYVLQPTEVTFDRALTLEDMKEGIGGGYVEQVPGFTTIAYQGVVLDCVALCDEDGKRLRQETNNPATLAWEDSLRRLGSTLLRPSGLAHDWLVGQVAVLFGDREFMESL